MILAIIEIAGAEAFVLSGKMIGDEVGDNFHTLFVNAGDKPLKIGHRAQIGVNGTIISNGVGRARTAFGNVRMRAGRFGSMFQNASQPNMGEAQVFDGIEGSFVNIIKGAAAVFSLAAVDAEVGLLVAKQSGEELIDVHTAKIRNFGKDKTLREKMYYFCEL